MSYAKFAFEIVVMFFLFRIKSTMQWTNSYYCYQNKHWHINEVCCWDTLSVLCALARVQVQTSSTCSSFVWLQKIFEHYCCPVVNSLRHILFSDKMEQQNAAANELFTKIQLAMTNQWRPEEFKRLKLVLPKHGKEKKICMMWFGANRMERFFKTSHKKLKSCCPWNLLWNFFLETFQCQNKSLYWHCATYISATSSILLKPCDTTFHSFCNNKSVSWSV